VSALGALQCLRTVLNVYKDRKLMPQNPLFTSLTAFVVGCPGDKRWLATITASLDLIYDGCSQPHKVAEPLLGRLAQDVTLDHYKSPVKHDYDDDVEGERGKVQRQALMKLLHVAGVVALKHVHFLDRLERSMKNQRQHQDSELEQIAGTVEDDVGEAVRFVREQELLMHSETVLSRLAPLVLRLASILTVQEDADLYRLNVLTLSRFMAVSGKFCEPHLTPFLTLLETSPDSVVRSNLTVAFGDLALSFNRLVDANLQFLMRRLEDAEASVRRTALYVLTHLALTGMVKVNKGKLGQVAKLLTDPDALLERQARVFFHELALKDNTVYNNLPDIISHLGQDRQIDEQKFSLIMRHLLEYVRKERQLDNLIDKLCQRFRATDDVVQWRYFAHCLSLLTFSTERNVRTLIANQPCFLDKCADAAVFRDFAEIALKARRFLPTLTADKEGNDFGAVLQDFEQHLLQSSGNKAGEDMQAIIGELRRLHVDGNRRSRLPGWIEQEEDGIVEQPEDNENRPAIGNRAKSQLGSPLQKNNPDSPLKKDSHSPANKRPIRMVTRKAVRNFMLEDEE
jgi:condensin complex subunit 1